MMNTCPQIYLKCDFTFVLNELCVCVLFFMGQVQGGLWLGRYSLYGWLRCIKVPEGRLGCKYCKYRYKVSHSLYKALRFDVTVNIA